MKKIKTLSLICFILSLALPASAQKIMEGINFVPTGGKTIQVIIDKPGVCYMGDIDLIRYETLSEPAARQSILISIEPLSYRDRNNFNSTHAQLLTQDPESLRDTVNLTSPRVNKDMIAGLFICKDSKHDRRCNNNDLIDFEKMEKKYTAKDFEGVPHGGEELTDKVYFFQPIILSSDGVYIMELEGIEDSYEKYFPELRHAFNESERDYKKQSKKVLKMSQRLRNFPLDQSGSSLVVTLPEFSEAKCERR